MNSKKLKLTLIGAAILLGAIALAAMSARVKDDKQAPVQPANAKPALSVSAITLEHAQWPRSLVANGSIAAWQEAIIGAEIGGLRLTEVRVNVGDEVKRGQLLARIASETVEAELAQARAAVEEARAMHAEALSNADRTRQLRAANFISAQQVTQAMAAEQAAAARLSAARARVRSNELRMIQTRVVAPDDGVISARAATVGSLAQTGQELFRLIRQNRLEWRAEVTAAELPRILPGQVARLTTDSGNEVLGKVRMAAPTVDPQTRTGLVYVDLPASNHARAGTFARGEFDLGEAPALTLPQSAVLLRDGFSYVFKLVDQNKVQLAKVSVGRRIADRIEVSAGLSAGTRVVASGAAFLTDGDTVRVVEAAAPMPPTAKKTP
ncbi:MAG: efflux RND transporter periplasmic adaptor subunit [Burkholderiales bacterium]